MSLAFKMKGLCCVSVGGWVFCSWMDLTASADHLERALWWASIRNDGVGERKMSERTETRKKRANFISCERQNEQSFDLIGFGQVFCGGRRRRRFFVWVRVVCGGVPSAISSSLFLPSAAGFVSEIDARLTRRCDAFRVRHSWAKSWAFMSEWEFD